MGMMKVTRAWVLAAAAALALGACGPKTETGAKSGGESGANGGASQGPLGGMFPSQRGSYKATYKLSAGSGGEMTIYSSDGKIRSENNMLSASKGWTAVSLIDPVAKNFVSFMVGPNAPKRATKLSADDIKRYQDMAPTPDAALKPTKIGDDMVAGLSCAIWQMPTPDGKDGTQVCVTADGIMLRTGPAASPILVATEVTKGPQDPALFTLPADYEVIDMGDCLAVMQSVGAAMKSGQPYDRAKVQDCTKKMVAGAGAP
jgi:hypothetical protein